MVKSLENSYSFENFEEFRKITSVMDFKIQIFLVFIKLDRCIGVARYLDRWDSMEQASMSFHQGPQIGGCPIAREALKVLT